MKSSPEVVKMPPSTLLELRYLIAFTFTFCTSFTSFLLYLQSHSFGYECHKRSNLLVLSKDVLIFAAGNYVQLFNLSSKQQTYLRTLGGGGVGALAVRDTPYSLVLSLYDATPLPPGPSKPHLLCCRREGTPSGHSCIYQPRTEAA